MEQRKPMSDPSVFNIFVFHMAPDLPAIKPPYVEADASPELIPEGFDYYAGGTFTRPTRRSSRLEFWCTLAVSKL
jgi:hypothetical protein